jgi:hypothetical protein
MSGAYEDPKRRAEIDLLLADLEYRIAQIRESQVSTTQLAVQATLGGEELRLSNRRFLVTAMAASATLLAAGAGLFAVGAAIWKPPTPTIIQMPAH